MSDTETKKERLEPTEEQSIYIRYSDELKDTMSELLADFNESGVIKGKNFYILTFADAQEKGAKQTAFEKKLEGKDCTISNYKKSIRTLRVEEAKKKVYVAEFGEEIDESALRGAFEKFGAIEDVILMRSPAKNNKPYAFVKFEEADAAKKAVEEGAQLGGEKALVEQSRPKRFVPREAYNRQSLQNSVMIANYDSSVSKDSIKKKAAENGRIDSFRFMEDHAIVIYRYPKHAEKAISNIDGVVVEGKTLKAVTAPKAVYYNSSRGFRGGRRGRGRGRRRGNRGRRRTEGGRKGGEATEQTSQVKDEAD